MRHSPITTAIGLGIAACSLLLAGCAGAAGNRSAVDYDHLPGSGDRMAQGPGIMSPQKGADYDDGVRLYSDEPSKRALVNRGSRTAAEAGWRPSVAAAPTSGQQREYEEFEAYQRFRDMPRDSDEYRRFKDWQEWRQYRQWRDGQRP